MSEQDDKALEYIANLVETRGYPPSVRELAEHLGYSSSERGHYALRRLVNRGLITVAAHTPRGITITEAGMVALTEEMT